MSDKTTNDEQQRQEPESVQQPETATGAAQEGQQPLKEEPPEREKLSEQRKEIKDKRADMVNPLEETEAALADMVNPLGDALEQWKEAEAQRRQQINEILNRTTAALPDISKQLSDSIRAALPDMSALSASLVESTAAAMRQIAESGLKIASFYESTSFTALQELVSGFDDYVEERERQFEAGDFTFLGAFVDNVDELLPYIKEEIEAYKKETGKETVTFDDFMYHATDPETGEEKASIFEKVLERAQERAEQDAAAAEAARKIEEAAAAAARIKCKHPDRYVIANTSLSNSMTGRTDKKTGEKIQVVNAGPFDLPVGRGDLSAYTMITLDTKEAGIELTGAPFTEYDRCVFNAVCSLVEAGNSVFAPEWVQWTMSNRQGSEMVSPAAVKDITESIEKMRYMHITCNVSDELRKRGVTDEEGNKITEWAIDGNMLDLKRHIATTEDGKTKIRYEITSEPVLLTYSKLNGQRISADIRLLDVRKVTHGRNGEHGLGVSIPTTATRQPIKEYLLRRIKVMKHDKERHKKTTQSRRILFDALYRESDIDTGSREKTRRAREYAFTVLDYWKEIGEIKGYTIINKGRKLYGIDIKI